MINERTGDEDRRANPDTEELSLPDDDERRRQAEIDLDVPIITALRDAAEGPVAPVRLTASNTFCFACHKGVSCWNECCHDTDITLTPYDLIRIGRATNTPSGAAGLMFGTVAVHEASGMPVLKLKRVDNGEPKRPCVFLDPVEGCTIYADRPAACRYYPLGLASVKMKGHDAPEDFYFLVKEPHCKGHEEKREQTVAEFRAGAGRGALRRAQSRLDSHPDEARIMEGAGRPAGQGAGRAHEKNVSHGDDRSRRIPAASCSARRSSSATPSTPRRMPSSRPTTRRS